MCVLAVVVALAGCKGPLQQNLPPAEMLMHPGPGVDGPGPGVMMYQPTMAVPPAAMVSQVFFAGPEGMWVRWDVSMPGAFDSEPLVVPGLFNFPQGAIYRLKLENIPGRPGTSLYPTLEIGLATPRTQAFLAHNAIPVQFTEEDFDQVLSGNFVTKVIYLPDPEFQELALAGVETLVSTRLDPGVDPIVEADRRGAILAIVRLGNKDLEIPGAVAGGVPGVVPASYTTAADPAGPTSVAVGIPGTPLGTPMGYPMPMPPGVPMGAAAAVPTNYIAGVTGPQYGMPMCGTPIGLPGPPHVPLGVPAGMQRHTIVNHTPTCLPGPTEHVRVDVGQSPGISYPHPANHAFILERTRAGLAHFWQPESARHQEYVPAPCTEVTPGNPYGPAAAYSAPAYSYGTGTADP
jgi:hypothetical protein